MLLPQMNFNCTGHITGWHAHTLVLTEENFIESLIHKITLQVWRPDLNNDDSYSLVGSSKLTFMGDELRNGITRIPDRNRTAFFSFNKTLSPSEWIHFLPGDTVGWFIPARFKTTSPPLSVLFSQDVTQQERNAVTMYALTLAEETCVLCDITEDSSADIFRFTIPLITPIYGDQ